MNYIEKVKFNFENEKDYERVVSLLKTFPKELLINLVMSNEHKLSYHEDVDLYMRKLNTTKYFYDMDILNKKLHENIEQAKNINFNKDPMKWFQNNSKFIEISKRIDRLNNWFDKEFCN